MKIDQTYSKSEALPRTRKEQKIRELEKKLRKELLPKSNNEGWIVRIIRRSISEDITQSFFFLIS